MKSMTMTRRGLQLGLSLVELMVAMVIGLIVMIVVYQMFVVSEGTRRTSIAGNDAQMSAAIAMGALQDGIRNGGYGLTAFDTVNGVRPLGCDVQGYDTRTGGFISFRLNPVTIAQGADNNPGTGVGRDADTISVVYSDLPYPTVPTNLLSGMADTLSDLRVTNRYAVTPGNVFILADIPANVTPPQAAAAFPVCALVEATGTPMIPGQLDVVAHGQGNYVDINGNNQAVRFNGPGGIGSSGGNPAGVMFNPSASVYNLGTNPAVVTFRVQNNQLMRRDLIANTDQALVDGVVSLQAQYGVGVDTNADGFADVFNPSGGQGTWQTALPANPGLVIAVRLAVLTRANLMESKDKTSGLCNATPAASPELVWVGGALDVTGTADWDCYRYKKFEMVVPLRNIIWMPT
jgi:type IV pilus assembly protein PilW